MSKALLHKIKNEDIQKIEIEKRAEYKKRLKRSLLDHVGIEILTGILLEDSNKARNELEIELKARLSSDEFLDIDRSNYKQLIEEVIDEIIGLGPLEKLLKDDEITEIMVNSTQSLYVERNGKLEPVKNVFHDEEQIRVIIDRILAPLGRRIDESSPVVNARLASGHRVNAVIPPIAIDGPTINIRKFSRKISTLEELVELKSLPNWYATLLKWAVQSRYSIAVIGGTGSGKTTLLNALSTAIDVHERIITIEDSAELKFSNHPHVVRLEARDKSLEGTGEITIRDLVKNALRMRPDRIVVGEVRGEEAIDMLQAMNTGHDGSLTTLHAGSAQEAIGRLVLLGRYGIDLPADVIEAQVASAIDFFVVQARQKDGTRVVEDLIYVEHNIENSSQDIAKLKSIVTYSIETKSWHLHDPEIIIKNALLKGVTTEQEVELWKRSLPKI